MAERWVPPGEQVVIAGRPVRGGLIYIGTPQSSYQARWTHPALIDPALPVQWGVSDESGDDESGEYESHQPSYSDMSPARRDGFLRWLDSGRCAPEVPPQYVRLYFTGLERRVLADIKLDNAHPEMPAVITEIRRLSEIYSDTNWVWGYTSRLLNLLTVSIAARQRRLPAPKSSELTRTWELPALVRVGIGRYLAARQPVPVEWALALARTHPEIYLRTPAARCMEEFDRLFTVRYSARYPAGAVPRAPKQRVEVRYMPLGHALGEVKLRFGDLPDVLAAATFIDLVRTLATESCSELDAYSRYLGRHPLDAGTLAAYALLPPELLREGGSVALGTLRAWVQATVDSGPVVVNGAELLALWSPTASPAKLTKQEAASFAALLSGLAAGIEPDPRFGTGALTASGPVVVFPLPAGSRAEPSAGLPSAMALLGLTAKVVAASGGLKQGQMQLVTQRLGGIVPTSEAEINRLRAHLTMLCAGGSAAPAQKRHLATLDDRQRAAAGQLLVAVAGAAGNVTAPVVAALTNAYDALDLDHTEVFSAVHAMELDAGPIRVDPGRPEERRWRLPAPPASTAPPASIAAVQLDRDKVRARLAETETVGEMLAEIFTDEGKASQPAPAYEGQDGSTVAGLDVAHSRLAQALHVRESWPRAEADAVAVSLGLPMLAGALDRINEAALDTAGEVLFEGDDPIQVNDYAVRKFF